MAGWTKDGQYLLIYDRFDIWQVRPDGSSAVDLTQGEGRKNQLQFRVVRFDRGDPSSRWIDPTKAVAAAHRKMRKPVKAASTGPAWAQPRRRKKQMMLPKNFAVPI